MPGRNLLVETRSAPTQDDPTWRGWLYVTDLADGTVRHDRVPTETFGGRGAVSPEGLVATPQQDAIRVWDPETAAAVRELPLPTTGTHGLWWFPDATALLVAAHNRALFEIAL